ncbi:CSC1-like protein RXW8 [Prunus avium]|uniref:CSC1-like protein RXW8 n=1 Tax=Prunus avium TaxID=42229 RepID=A0A6P5R4W7_PRUAV|nr:CSC1-like protein RXW8 [Prunus avium]XP_021800029.1 CSC1-like protein RXW8 [Prunus avium]XP_021800030.1 CSC1-like protein RXW8 [Prunus avium]
MNLAALLTSAGINIAVCVILFSLYSILRKQPSNVNVYFGRRISIATRRSDPFCLDRFVPSASWLLKAWRTKEEDLLAVGGLDSVVFIRMVVFSLRIFSIAAVVCVFIVLPVNYHGRKMLHQHIPLQSLEVFTILNVQEGSKWLWTHCLALYIITFSACILLYFEYKTITKMRLAHITASSSNPSYFTVVVRAIPWSVEESYSDSVRKFFTKYHASSYLSHQMVYRSGKIQKLMSDAGKVCKILKDASVDQTRKPDLFQCGFCGGATDSFKILSNETESVRGKSSLIDDGVGGRKKVCAAAFVFFKTRYAAVVTSQVLQSSNPMLWVTDMAPEPNDVYWSNLWIPYGQLWIRKIATLLAAIAFMLVFLIPVTFVQGLTQLEFLQAAFPFLRGLLKKKIISQLVTGYLPSVVLILAFYSVPPVMMLFSTAEGCISRSGRKKSACFKVLYFTIWNVFFVNIFTGSLIRQLSVFASVKDIPVQLANAVPAQAKFFMTYVLSSGWASLACELMQIYPLLCNYFRRFILLKDGYNDTLTFPYHTEIPRVLLFGFVGFTCSILVPLILPFLLVYFVLAYLIYRNQILNVYIPKYESGGQFWPMMHNTVIVSLILMQIIALGVFGLRRSPIASGFTIPLLIFTLLFNEYCRQRFHPIFRNHVSEILMEMDRKDEQLGRMEEVYKQLHSAYCQSPVTPDDSFNSGDVNHNEDGDSIQDPENVNPGKEPSQVNPTWDVTFDTAESSQK